MDEQSKEQIMGVVWEVFTSPTDNIDIDISNERHVEANQPI